MALDYTKQLYANHAATTLASAISASDSVISVTDGSRFPQPSGGSSFLATITNGSSVEVVRVYGRTGNALTGCLRGQEGTQAQTFASGSRIENRVTAGTLAQFARLSDRLTPIDKLLDLKQPEALNNNSYVVSESDDAGNPIVAISSSGKWRFVNYPSVVVQGAADPSSTATSVNYPGTVNVSSLVSERGLIIQFITGNNRGQARYIVAASSSSVSWQNPLPYTPLTGDRFEIYQSASSRLDQLMNQVSFLLQQAGVGGGAGFLTTAALEGELAKLGFKKSVRVATTGNIVLTGLQTIDGVSVLAGDRVLVKNQTAGADNGIYTADAGTWVRTTDADSSIEMRPTTIVGVEDGTTQADTFWKLATNNPITLGTTPLSFVNVLTGYAPLSSPAFTDTPTAPTAAAGANTTQLATTAFVTNAVNTGVANAILSAASTSVQKDSNTGAAQLPSGTTAQRPANGAGRLRYNQTTGRFEGNNGSAWGSLGGATGGGTDAVFYLNSQAITVDYTIPTGQNAMCAGPITINDGVTVTVPDGSVWTVV